MDTRTADGRFPDVYRFVRASDGGLLHVAEIDPADRHGRGPYACLACGHAMVPALGRRRAHHFKHKAGRPEDCLQETYLHRLAKLTLFSAISEAMRTGSPYLLTRQRPIICDHFSAGFGLICTGRQMALPEDLAARFDTIEMEKGIDGFVADLLLRSDRTGARMLIEITVTHPCDPEKAGSGLDILDLRIRSEADVEKLRAGIDATGADVRWHGPDLSHPDPVAQRCTTPCAASGLLLLLYRNGKAWYAESPLSGIAEITRDPRLLAWEIVDPQATGQGRPQGEILDRLIDFAIRQRYGQGLPVASCMLCHENGGRRSDHDIFCATQGRVVWMSSSASGCASYAPASGPDEARQLFNARVR